MEAVAKLKNYPTGPRKMRLLADVIRGMEVEKSLSILEFHPQHNAKPRAKLLKSAIANWQQKNAGASLADLDMNALPAGHDTDLQYASQLQQIRPAFGLLGISDATDIAVAAPLDAEGRPLPRPAGLAVPRQRGISVAGPLRSFVLLAHSPPPMAWRHLSLEVAPERQVGIAQSRLAAHLEGVLYERH